MTNKPAHHEPSSSDTQLDPPQHDTLLLQHERAETFPSGEHTSQIQTKESSFASGRIHRTATVESDTEDDDYYDNHNYRDEILQNKIFQEGAAEPAHFDELLVERSWDPQSQSIEHTHRPFSSAQIKSWDFAKDDHASKKGNSQEYPHAVKYGFESDSVNRGSYKPYENASQPGGNLVIPHPHSHLYPHPPPPSRLLKGEHTRESTGIPAHGATLVKHEQNPTLTHEGFFPERKVVATKYPDDLRSLNNTISGRHARRGHNGASSRRPYVLDYWSKEGGPKIGYEDELRLKDDEYASDTGSELGFDFGFTKKRSASADSEQFDALKPPLENVKADDGARIEASRVDKISHGVLRSSYVNASDINDISVDIDTTQNLDRLSLYESSLFRWIHIKPTPSDSRSLNFLTFIESILDTPSLNQEEKSTINNFLSDTRKDGERALRTLQGLRGNFRDPSCIRWGDKKVTFLGLPYFSLEKYVSQELLPMPSSYPARTILQMKFPSESKERDMQQAITFAPETPKDFCYHAPQIWSLILDKKLLVTYAPTGLPELCDNKVGLNIVPRPKNVKEKYLHVVEHPHRSWMFPLDTCGSYFEFIAHFAETICLRDNVEDHYKFYWRNNPLVPHRWSLVVFEAQRERTQIRVQRLSGGKNEEILTGYAPEWYGERRSKLNPRSFQLWNDERRSKDRSPYGWNDERRSRSRSKSAKRWSDERKSRSKTRSLNRWGDGKRLSSSSLRIESDGIESRTASSEEKHKNNVSTSSRNSKGVTNDQSRYMDDIERPSNENGQEALPNSSFHVDNGFLPDHRIPEEPQSDEENQHNMAFKKVKCNSDNTILPKSLVNVKYTKSLGFDFIVQVEDVCFSERLSPSDELLILLSSRTLSQTTKEKNIALSECCPDPGNLFHYILRLDSNNDKLPNVEKLHTALFSLFNSLWHFSRIPERQAFRSSPFLTVQGMERLLSFRAAKVIPSHNFIRFYHNAWAVLDFFAPSGLEVPIFCKYWGAVYKITAEESFHCETMILPIFDDITQCLNGFRELLSWRKAPKNLRLPNLFTSAWLHCLVSLTLCNATMFVRAKHHMIKADDFILRGKVRVQKEMARKSLRLYQVVSPYGVLLAVAHNLIQSTTKGQSDILQSYWNYFGQLRYKFQKTPLKRAHQQKFMFLRHEVEILKKISQEQRLVIEQLGSTCININEVDDPQTLMYKSCLECIDAKICGFNEIVQQTGILSEESFRMIDSNKDRQEAAIYIFTIVTIVFLPLSFVSSLLGMNTADIRNMDRTHWLFWSAAIPLTVSIVIVCLLFTGDLLDLANWARKLLSQRPSTRRHKATSNRTNKNANRKTRLTRYKITDRLRRKGTNMSVLD